VSIADGGACSRAQLAGVRRIDATSQVVATGVSCPRWIAASAGERRGSVMVASCERDRCGPLLEWRVERRVLPEAPQPPTQRRWPAWATWTLVGIGAATATSVALIASGVFEGRAVEQRFVVGGARQE
jgi:hypothetical protein